MVLSSTSDTSDISSVARSAGFADSFCVSDPGVALRFTPGFTLSPAPRVLQTFLRERSWGCAALHFRLYGHPIRGLDFGHAEISKTLNHDISNLEQRKIRLHLFNRITDKSYPLHRKSLIVLGTTDGMMVEKTK